MDSSWGLDICLNIKRDVVITRLESASSRFEDRNVVPTTMICINQHL